MDSDEVKNEGSESENYHPAYDSPGDDSRACVPENEHQRPPLDNSLQGFGSFKSWLPEYRKVICAFEEKATQEIHQKEQALEEANQHIQMLEAELRKCQMRLSKFIPDYQPSDTTIREKFISIRENLSNWTEEFPDVETFKDSLISAHRKFEFPLKIYGWGMRCPGWPSNAQSEIFMCMVWWPIWDTLFMPLVIAPPSDLRVLRTLERGIYKVNPDKGVQNLEIFNLWRSDTIRAYVSGQQHHIHVKKCSELTARLREIFDSFNFKSDFDRNRKLSRLEEQIKTPAANLAISLSCSPESFNIMDIATHNKISKRKNNDVRESEKIVKLLLVMFPALYRRGRGDEPDILIEKATILIHVNPDLPTPTPTVTVEVGNSQRLA
ncbi:uncharacterized protein KD926_011391 [Aspergillus affinis]|uniref:uncharacterized protein n=1 Tax=Aspergillus affinis TaxID=1070780 RepID=UPI0022FE60B8|nr:uncharacterized protein KD926_011391 [Aspergillus affinis]KAI9037959.1 hypothetical protein KD926_011391 [Aspergillus affinis]